MKKTNTLLAGVAGALLVAAVAAWYVTSPGSSSIAAAPASSLPADRVLSTDKVMGSASAPVTMIEYYSQGCSVCARFNGEVFPLLKAKYIDTGKVRYVMRLYPLFPIDGPAHKLTRCVAPEHFFEAVDLLFRNQPQWDTAEFPQADAGGLFRMARILGLSSEQAQKCMNATDLDASINKIGQEGDARYGIDGTPTFIINYRKVDMPQKSWAEAQAALDAALAAKGK